jgi:hypothetical protein
MFLGDWLSANIMSTIRTRTQYWHVMKPQWTGKSLMKRSLTNAWICACRKKLDCRNHAFASVQLGSINGLLKKPMCWSRISKHPESIEWTIYLIFAGSTPVQIAPSQARSKQLQQLQCLFIGSLDHGADNGESELTRLLVYKSKGDPNSR